MMLEHGWQEEKAHEATLLFSLYIPRKRKPNVKRLRINVRQYCPVSGCQKVCRSHKIKRGEYYRRLLMHSQGQS